MNEQEKKVINIFIEKCNKYNESVEIKGISVGEEYRMLNTVCKALKLIEKLQKENEELENDNRYLREREAYLEKRRSDIIKLFQNQQTATTIPIQKIKDKIEEISKMIDYEHNDKVIVQLAKQKRVLQELLDGSDTDVGSIESED